MRLFALAIAAVLGSGCVVNTACDGSAVAVTWSFRDVNGASNLSCAAVGVTAVDLYFNGQFVDRYACSQGGATVPVASGTFDVTVEGIAPDGTIINRDQFTASVRSCGTTTYAARPGEGDLRIDYSIAPVNSCGGGYIWFSLYDEVAGQVISAIGDTSSSVDKTLFFCPAEVRIPVPYGTYTLDWIQEVATPLTAPTALHQQCSPTTVSVNGPGVTALPVVMGNVVPGVSCF
jgi:hypothetical protein